MPHSVKRRRLKDAYQFAGFRPQDTITGVFGDPFARVIRLVRRSKKLSAARAEEFIRVGTIEERGEYATFRMGASGSTWSSSCGACIAEAAAR